MMRLETPCAPTWSPYSDDSHRRLGSKMRLQCWCSAALLCLKTLTQIALGYQHRCRCVGTESPAPVSYFPFATDYQPCPEEVTPL